MKLPPRHRLNYKGNLYFKIAFHKGKFLRNPAVGSAVTRSIVYARKHHFDAVVVSMTMVWVMHQSSEKPIIWIPKFTLSHELGSDVSERASRAREQCGASE